MNGETVGPVIGAAGLASFAAAVVAVKTGALDELAAAAAPRVAAGLLVLAGVALVALVSAKTRGAVGHVHGGGRRRRAEHEARHVIAAEAVGARVASAHIRGGGGEVDARGLPNAKAELVFLLAGGVGDDRGCRGDREDVERVLQEWPTAEQGAALAAARRDAARIVHAAKRSGRLDEVAEQLVRRGRL